MSEDGFYQNADLCKKGADLNWQSFFMTSQKNIDRQRTFQARTEVIVRILFVCQRQKLNRSLIATRRWQKKNTCNVTKIKEAKKRAEEGKKLHEQENVCKLCTMNKLSEIVDDNLTSSHDNLLSFLGIFSLLSFYWSLYVNVSIQEITLSLECRLTFFPSSWSTDDDNDTVCHSHRSNFRKLYPAKYRNWY